MMIGPETYYEEHLKGKTAAKIMTTIRALKKEINQLKKTVENPVYVSKMNPDERVRIWCNRMYLERSKLALTEAGGEYVPMKSELAAAALDESMPSLTKMTFSIGGYFSGYEKHTFTVDGDKITEKVVYTYLYSSSYVDKTTTYEYDKAELLDGLRKLHIGEWLRKYSIERWGVVFLEGTQWLLEMEFSNGHKPVIIDGDNDYPYNFGELLGLLGIEDVPQFYSDKNE